MAPRWGWGSQDGRGRVAAEAGLNLHIVRPQAQADQRTRGSTQSPQVNSVTRYVHRVTVGQTTHTRSGYRRTTTGADERSVARRRVTRTHGPQTQMCARSQATGAVAVEAAQSQATEMGHGGWTPRLCEPDRKCRGSSQTPCLRTTAHKSQSWTHLDGTSCGPGGWTREA